MADTSWGEAAGAAAQGLASKVGAGMIGAVILYMVLPPVNEDGTFNRREFISRLAVAGVISAFFGDWSVDLLVENWPALHAEKHRAGVYLLTGAPAWWVSRAAALWLRRRQNKDLGQVADEFRRPKGE